MLAGALAEQHLSDREHHTGSSTPPMKPRHIVLISGPSGCGKSTLIRQLAASTLAPEILARLPEQSGSWPVVEANDVLKGTLSTQALRRDKNPADGWLVHYDIVFIHCYGIQRYEDDPALDLLTGADSLDVVFIRPDCDRLLTQFFKRQTRHRKTKSKASLLWGGLVRRPLRRVLASFSGKPILTTDELYSKDQWLAGCYRQWENYIHGLIDRVPNARILTVEPAPDPNHPENFRRVAHPDMTSSNNHAGNE
jgi:hypothetical protein